MPDVKFNIYPQTRLVEQMLKIFTLFTASINKIPSFYFGSTKMPHQILGIRRDASESQIKCAFYKLAKQCHPDHNQDSEANQKFNIARNAYEHMLNNQQINQQNQSRNKQSDPSFSEQDFEDFSRGFEEFIRQGYTRNKYKKNQKAFKNTFSSHYKYSRRGVEEDQHEYPSYLDIHKTIFIYPQEVGFMKAIKLSRRIICQNCRGTKKQIKPSKCRGCKGRGYDYKFHKCSFCFGNGKQKTTCHKCKGKGFSFIQVNQIVSIPRSIANGDCILVQGKGNQDLQKKKFGDLIVQFIIKKEKRTERSSNSFGEHKISALEAVLGLKTGIETADGIRKVRIPSGIQDGEMIKVEGGGKKEKYKNRNGDHFVKIRLQIPKTISEEERELYRRLRQIEQKIDNQ